MRPVYSRLETFWLTIEIDLVLELLQEHKLNIVPYMGIHFPDFYFLSVAQTDNENFSNIFILEVY